MSPITITITIHDDCKTNETNTQPTYHDDHFKGNKQEKTKRRFADYLYTNENDEKDEENILILISILLKV